MKGLLLAITFFFIHSITYSSDGDFVTVKLGYTLCPKEIPPQLLYLRYTVMTQNPDGTQDVEVKAEMTSENKKLLIFSNDPDAMKWMNPVKKTSKVKFKQFGDFVKMVTSKEEEVILGICVVQ